jgi:hypothetical protein
MVLDHQQKILQARHRLISQKGKIINLFIFFIFHVFHRTFFQINISGLSFYNFFNFIFRVSKFPWRPFGSRPIEKKKKEASWKDMRRPVSTVATPPTNDTSINLPPYPPYQAPQVHTFLPQHLTTDPLVASLSKWRVPADLPHFKTFIVADPVSKSRQDWNGK